MWRHSHLPIIFLQALAFPLYIIGSRRFYLRKDNFMILLFFGIILDIIMTLIPFMVELPRMSIEQSAPWNSYLFIFHIASAGIGMFGFIIMLIILQIKGTELDYTFLRIFQYKFLLRLWIIGVGIALINFFVKVMFQFRIYDYF